jgi:hypothetical protein
MELVASEELVISTGYPFFQTCDPEKTAERDASGAIPCLSGNLTMHGQVVARQECRYLPRNVTHLHGKEGISVSLLTSKFAHFNHLASACMSVMQTVFADAAYDVYNDSYFSNHDSRAITGLLLLSMTVTVQFLIQGLFVAGKFST